MHFSGLNSRSLKILLFVIFFALISLVFEIAFFNKDVFYSGQNASPPTFDYFWIRHLAVFAVFILLFLFQRKDFRWENVKPYAAFALLFINIIPGVSFVSKYLFLFLSFLLFLFIKSGFNLWGYRKLLLKSGPVIVFFLVCFVVFFPLFFEEGYIFDPLYSFTSWPGYRMVRVEGLRETTHGSSDLLDAFMPQWQYTYRSIRQGTFPLWRYNKGLGVPQYEQSYHPEKLIAFIVDPAEALTIRVLTKLFLSMIGMTLLLRALRIREAVCLIGGVAFAFSGFIVAWLHGPQSSVVYHIPFLFLFLVRFLNTKRIKYLLYFALWCSLTIYSGFFPVAAYAFYGIVLFLFFYYLFDKQRLGNKIKEAFKISIFWVLGIFIMLFNFILLYYVMFVSKTVDVSYRQIGRVNFIDPKYFKNILFPFYFDWRITPEVRPYVSSIVLFFLVIGVFFLGFRFFKFKRDFLDREKVYLSFLLLVIPFLLAMFGMFPFYQISCKLPVLNSSPLNRLQSMTSFCLVILGMKGLDVFIQSFDRIIHFFRKRRIFFLAIVEIFFLASAFLAVKSLASGSSPGYHALYPVFIFLFLVILAFQIFVFFRKSPVFFLMVLLFLVSGEMVIHNRRYVPVNRSVHFITKLKIPLIQYLRKNIRTYEGVLVFDSNFNVNGTLGNYGLREKIVHQGFHPDLRALIVETFSEESFVTPTAPALASRPTDFSSSLIQLMGIKYLIFRHEFGGENLPRYYKLVYDDVDGKVYENILVRKHNGIFFGRPKYYGPEEKISVLKDLKSLDYTQHVYVERGQEFDLEYGDDLTSSVRVVEYTPNRIIYRYRARSDGILTFPEAFDRDWSATVNGQPADVLRTNLVFRGIALKKGRGEIVFRFHTSSRFKLLVLFGVVLLAVLIMLYLVMKKHESRIEERVRKSMS